MKRYEQIFHTADLAAIIYGQDIKELFENSAYAMFDMMGDIGGLGASEIVKVHLVAPDRESLLISWLNELLYLSYSKSALFSEFNVTVLTETELQAEAKGQSIAKDIKRLHTEIKAATYHDLKIQQTNKIYMVTIVFDV